MFYLQIHESIECSKCKCTQIICKSSRKSPGEDESLIAGPEARSPELECSHSLWGLGESVPISGPAILHTFNWKDYNANLK